MSFVIPARASRSGDDPIFSLNQEARTRARSGEAVINATVGALLDEEGKLAILPTAAQLLREVSPELASSYAPIAGSADFLAAVTRDLLGDRPAAAWVASAATPGGTGALRHAITCFLEPGQSLLTSSFYWGPYKTLADENDRGLAAFRMFDERGGFDVADFERKLFEQLDTQGRALVFLNSPCHNPTGYSLDDHEWDAVIDVVARASERGEVALLLDIAYVRYGATDLGSVVDRVLALAGKAMILFAWSASKAFTAYGWRVGALVAIHPDAAVRASVQNALSFACRGVWSNCNAAGMGAIAKILGDAELSARVDRERSALKALLDRRVLRWNELAGKAGLRYPRYDGGFFTTVFCDDAHGAALRLKASGIFVVPQAGALRVALCSVADRDVARLVEGIAKQVG